MSKKGRVTTVQDREGKVWTGEDKGARQPDFGDMVLGAVGVSPPDERVVEVNGERHTGKEVK